MFVFLVTTILFLYVSPLNTQNNSTDCYFVCVEMKEKKTIAAAAD